MSQPLNQTSAPAAGENSDKIKEKIGKYIKDLEDLKLGYDIKYIEEEIEGSYKITTSAKEALKATYNVLYKYFQDAKEKTWLLSKAYNDDATGSMLTNAVGLYTDLIIINALRKFIDSYDLETEPRFASPTFIDFTGKTKDVLIMIISKYINSISERKKEKLVENVITKFSEAISHVGAFKEEFSKYKEKFEEKESLTVGEYRVLANALKMMKQHYIKAIRFIKNARATVIVESRAGRNVAKKITWKTAEAHALTNIPFAFYEILCSNKYNICFKWYRFGFTGPIADMKIAICRILDPI